MIARSHAVERPGRARTRFAQCSPFRWRCPPVSRFAAVMLTSRMHSFAGSSALPLREQGFCHSSPPNCSSSWCTASGSASSWFASPLPASTCWLCDWRSCEWSHPSSLGGASSCSTLARSRTLLLILGGAGRYPDRCCSRDTGPQFGVSMLHWASSI